LLPNKLEGAKLIRDELRFAQDTRVRARDLFKRVDLGVFVGRMTAKAVQVHGLTMLRLSLSLAD
jgi:hypothetical protein